MLGVPSIITIDTIKSPYRLTKLNGVYSIVVYPRVHMFSLDLSLASGIIRHGSMGVSIGNLPITIRASKSLTNKDSLTSSINLNDIDKVINLDKLREYLGKDDFYDIEINCEQPIVAHTGIGVSTQILGGVFLGCAGASDVFLSHYDLFMLGVGHTSTLGLNLLFHPGFMLEIGCRITDSNRGIVVNPSLSSYHEEPSSTIYKINNFPFYIIMAIPVKIQSMFGETEKMFWDSIFPDKKESSWKISYEILSSIIPSITERKYSSFIKGMEAVVSIGTKPFEEKTQNKITKKILHQAKEKFGFATVSSMGPSIYCFSKDNPKKQIDEINASQSDFLFFCIKECCDNAKTRN